ncbi:class I SAM-dependent methyltransferase [Taibaiella lutea]|uniref:Class I SAM-dependent methyltransferase n=1 Tax=Taibaiella lutea TaxID=2608001 RepID=A0A5M6CNY0_9BACT|nr:class I SAM-dependent methyltransferase [Taibaiella lutea]KAA5534859.1 class I SAM-dependent methyltransferase [Taibaiella lutea]
MNIPQNYKAINKDAWNKRTDVHVSSSFYDVEGFFNGASSLQTTESALLGDIHGKSVLHLQCHFGMDTLSMARMGASVTGVDLSDKAIEKAEELNRTLGLNARFICCDLYDLEQNLDEQFDVVFTTYGTIGWLPDLEKWGAIIQRFLKPGGKFVFAEFHPVMWMFDNQLEKIEYSYFNREAIVEDSTGTYTDRNAQIEYTEISWNHSLDEVFSALLHHGISIEQFREYDFSHYNCFSNLKQIAPDKYQHSDVGGKIPMMYSIVGRKCN